MEFLCLLLSRAQAAHSVLGYCHENAQSETKRSFKVGGCWSVLGFGLSPVLRKQKQQVVLFRVGMSLLGQVLTVAGTFPVAFGPEEIPSVPCFLCLFSNNFLHICLCF